jgi:phenylacetate-CoA ligase (EC 6.2.1.30)
MRFGYHNEKLETASREKLRDIQTKGLRRTVRHVYESNPVYRRLFDAHGVSPEEIKTLDDLQRLPMTNKELLRENYPLGLSCVPRDSIVEMHMSSGSTGTPVIMPYTEGDLAQWAECMARCYMMSGARRVTLCRSRRSSACSTAASGCIMAQGPQASLSYLQAPETL